MKARMSVTVVGFLLLTFLLVSSTAAIAADFYQGKTIRFIVGFAAGGGYDAYTRMVARYITRYIPGKSHHGGGEHGRRRQPHRRAPHL